MRILNYSEWKDTALTLHQLSQMLGKTKLAWLEPQPEWNHSLLQINADGFTTGLINNGANSFEVRICLEDGKVEALNLNGEKSSFSFESGKSVAQYYEMYKKMLEDVMCHTNICTTPMEMSITTPFEKNHTILHYDATCAKDFHRMMAFAYEQELKFVSSFRGKKILPSFFWGTFDMSAVLFSGKEEPFPYNGYIEKSAFDEQMIEFGFWPGDDVVDEPAFFILPYPFITKDLTKTPIQPDKAYYSKEKAEYFLTLRDAWSYDDPAKAVIDFFTSAYKIVTEEEGWKNLEWFDKPLLAEKGSPLVNKHNPSK